MRNHVIPAVDKCKYLIVVVSESNCDHDLKSLMQKYYANANILIQKFSYSSPDVKCYIFISYCATMYCPSMWFDSTVTAVKKLKIDYHNRMFLGSYLIFPNITDPPKSKHSIFW